MAMKSIPANGITTNNELVKVVNSKEPKLAFTKSRVLYIKTSGLMCVAIQVNKRNNEILLNYNINPNILVLLMATIIGALPIMIISAMSSSSKEGKRLVEQYANEIENRIRDLK